MKSLPDDYSVTWKSPANIALIKYWGKSAGQIPKNASISITLSRSLTRTTVSATPTHSPEPGHRFLFEGKPEPTFEARVLQYLNRMKEFFPYLKNHTLAIDSGNTFPHSSGISSSASFMSSLALGLCSLLQQLTGKVKTDSDFFKNASSAARLGSGSAARSLYGGFCVWGETDAFPGSSNKYGIQVTRDIHPVFLTYRDAILIVSSERKSLSSSAGQQLMEHHPYAELRYQQAQKNMIRMKRILAVGEEEEFVHLVEQEALGLHGLIQSSEAGPLLLQPATLSLIRLIRDFRLQTGISLCFTLDAGPNIHLLYPASAMELVHEFIKIQAVEYCENGKWIDDFIGEGPKQITR